MAQPPPNSPEVHAGASTFGLVVEAGSQRGDSSLLAAARTATDAADSRGRSAMEIEFERIIARGPSPMDGAIDIQRWARGHIVRKRPEFSGLRTSSSTAHEPHTVNAVRRKTPEHCCMSGSASVPILPPPWLESFTAGAGAEALGAAAADWRPAARVKTPPAILHPPIRDTWSPWQRSSHPPSRQLERQLAPRSSPDLATESAKMKPTWRPSHHQHSQGSYSQKGPTATHGQQHPRPRPREQPQRGRQSAYVRTGGALDSAACGHRATVKLHGGPAARAAARALIGQQRDTAGGNVEGGSMNASPLPPIRALASAGVSVADGGGGMPREEWSFGPSSRTEEEEYARWLAMQGAPLPKHDARVSVAAAITGGSKAQYGPWRFNAESEQARRTARVLAFAIEVANKAPRTAPQYRRPQPAPKPTLAHAQAPYKIQARHGPWRGPPKTALPGGQSGRQSGGAEGGGPARGEAGGGADPESFSGGEEGDDPLRGWTAHRPLGSSQSLPALHSRHAHSRYLSAAGDGVHETLALRARARSPSKVVQGPWRFAPPRTTTSMRQPGVYAGGADAGAHPSTHPLEHPPPMWASGAEVGTPVKTPKTADSLGSGKQDLRPNMLPEGVRPMSGMSEEKASSDEQLAAWPAFAVTGSSAGSQNATPQPGSTHAKAASSRSRTPLHQPKYAGDSGADDTPTWSGVVQGLVQGLAPKGPSSQTRSPPRSPRTRSPQGSFTRKGGAKSGGAGTPADGGGRLGNQDSVSQGGKTTANGGESLPASSPSFPASGVVASTWSAVHGVANGARQFGPWRYPRGEEATLPRRGGDEFKIVSKEALTMSPTFALPERSYRPSAIEHRGPWRDPSP